MNKEEQKNVWPGWQVTAHIGGNRDRFYRIQREADGTVEKAMLKEISISENSNRIKRLYKDVNNEHGIHAMLENELQCVISDYSVMRKMDGCPYAVNCDGLRYEQQEAEAGWNVYIKMEQVESLESVLPSVVPEDAVVQIARDLSSALDYGKRIGVFHRNITPQSIYISEAGICKLGDYGAERAEEAAKATFLAPEAYKTGIYDIRTDIYSLGLVLYWILNDRKMPFEKGSDNDTARDRRLSGEMLPAPERGNDKLKAIVLKACAYDPKDRYQLPSELQQDLSQLQIENQMILLSEWYSRRVVEDKENLAEITPPHVTDSGNNDEELSNAVEFPDNDSEGVPKRKRGIRRLIVVFSAVLLAAIVIIVLLLHSCSGKTESADYEESTGEITTQDSGESIPTDALVETTEEIIEETTEIEAVTKGKQGKANGNTNSGNKNTNTGTTEDIPTEPESEEHETSGDSTPSTGTTAPDDDFKVDFGDLLG